MTVWRSNACIRSERDLGQPVLVLTILASQVECKMERIERFRVCSINGFSGEQFRQQLCEDRRDKMMRLIR